jgi:PAS domain S-box-containing protein
MAVLVPIRDRRGAVRGAVVGEAYASAVFAGLEAGTPGLTGVTGLVDADGHFLYHSIRKRDWASLLATRSQLDLASEFSGTESESILSGRVGMLLASRSRLVAFAPLRLGTPAIRPLILYRAVPLAALEAPIREFLRWVAIVGLLLVVGVLVLAAVASNQFTRPIYQLRTGVAQLARGASQKPLEIATNDEFEDLASDFSAMAASLSDYRGRLEEALTERTRALQQTHAELSDVLEHSADAIIGLDREGRVRVWNRGAERLFGYGAAEAIGSDADALLAPAPSERTAEAVFIRRELAQHGAVVNLPTRRRAKDGTLVPVTLTQTLLGDTAGAPYGASLILRDASKQAVLEEQMRRSERLAAVSVMAAGLAHELNNPLAVIANRIECMEHEVRSRCSRCFLEQDLAVLGQHAARLSGVTQDLLRFTRDGDAAAAPLNLGVLATRIVHLLEHTFVGSNIRVDLVVADDLPPVLGSERALETVCMNLLLNAAEAMPAGGTARVEIHLAVEEEAVDLTVSDTGSGIPAELRQRIFEPFFTTKGEKGGTGLGLAVCRSIVERHRGRIRVENAAGGGARFVVTLPAARSEPA